MRVSESEYTSPDQLDFVPRERRNQITRILFAFFITTVLICAFSFMPESMGGKALSGLVSLSAIAVLCFYVVFSKQQNLDLVMNTEYQNMLFSQIVSMGSSFCMIVRRDGTIFYANDGLRRIFPHYAYSDSRALEALFEQGGMRRPERERIMAAIYSNQSDRLVFPLRLNTGEEKEFILTLEPLPRPAGYIVIRGREYKDTRIGTQLLPELLRSTSAERLEHLLGHTPAPLFVVDAFGRFEYANAAFEQLLAYRSGELLGDHASLQTMLAALNGRPLSDDYTVGDFSGTVTLQKKTGELVHAMLHQSAQRDESGKILGASGTIVPVS